MRCNAFSKHVFSYRCKHAVRTLIVKENIVLMPNLVVFAGPNGAGKTTTAKALLADEVRVDEFVNAEHHRGRAEAGR